MMAPFRRNGNGPKLNTVGREKKGSEGLTGWVLLVPQKGQLSLSLLERVDHPATTPSL